MLGCVGVLMAAMVLVGVKYGAEKAIVKMHMDHAFVRALAPDVANESAIKEHPVAWETQYPFPEERKPLLLRILSKTEQLKTTLEKGPEKKVMDRTSEKFIGYHWLVEHGRSLEDTFGWGILNPSMNVICFPDGYWTYVNRRSDMTEQVTALENFAKMAKDHHADFLFVQSPFKVNKYGDAEIQKGLDYANENADRRLEALRHAGVRTLDLREEIARVPEAEYHAQFYRTDHHWKPQTALRAANNLAVKLREFYGIETDTTNLSEEKYQWHTKKEWFLGSQGKKVTLARTRADDFTWMEPKFPTKIHLEIPVMGMDETGDFSIMLDHRQMDRKDLYVLSPYHAFLYGDQAFVRIDNLNLSDAPEQKILAFTDSFGDAMIPFLAMGVKHIVKIDLRAFHGSVASLIEQEKPDVVIVMYTAFSGGKIHSEGHKDLFDFR